MPNNTSAQSTVLNKYLHENHGVYDGIKSTSTSPCTRANVASEEKAVENLDKQMKTTTDADLLKEARQAQRGLDPIFRA